MNEEELIRETRKLIGRWDNIRIVGQGWAGDTRRGFQFNPVRTRSEGGTTPVTPSGACCPLSGDCFTSTQAVCEGGGGTYQGNGTLCVPDPCTPDSGACCVGEDCSIETESDCTGMGGTFQGVGTTCSPNPCIPTGACCDSDNNCTITTEEDCTGTYQGDGTLCDPNPCGVQPPCCIGGAFHAFDFSGRQFFRYHRAIIGHYEFHAIADGCFFNFDETLDGSANYEAHYEAGEGGECVLVVDDDTSSSQRVGDDICPPRATLECFCNVTSEANECTGPLDYCQCSIGAPSITVDTTETTRITTWDLNASCHIDCEPGTYDCSRSGYYIVTETLSQECIP